MTNIIDSILVFEFFTASGIKDKSIISEAEAMIFNLIYDLKDYNVSLCIHESYRNHFKNHENIIYINENLIEWLEKNVADYDSSIFIAAEDNDNLYNISRILEENNVKLYTSSSQVCKVTSDKFNTYESLMNIVPQPSSFKINIDAKGYWKNNLINLFDEWKSESDNPDFKIILKPLSGVDCESVTVIESEEDITYDLEKIFIPNSDIIVQEYIEGTDISVSLICDGQNAIPISLNEQYIDINDNNLCYQGGLLPFNSKFKNEAFKFAKKACETLNVKGFAGVDLRIASSNNFDNNVYVLEVNSRFTTPYVGLCEVAEFNIPKSIIQLLNGELSPEDIDFKFNGKIEYIKGNDTLEVRRL